MTLRCLPVVLVAALLSLPALAQDEGAPAPAAGEVAGTGYGNSEAMHDALRVLRDDLVRAINAQDMDAVLPHLHPDIVVTWQNAEVSRGHDGVREYYERMMEGPGRIVKKFEFAVEPEALTIFHGGDAGISYGNSTEKFELSRGLSFEHHGRWSATLVHDQGRWLLASFHASTNLFDNPLLTIARKSRVWVGIAAGVVGLLLGWFLRSRRKSATA